MGLREILIVFEFDDQPIVRFCLLDAEPGEERNQK